MYFIKRFFSVSFLVLSIFTLFIGSANAQLQAGKGFGQYFDRTFNQVYDTNSQDLENSLPKTVGTLISTVLGLIGVVLIVIIVWAGWLWLTARGNDDQVSEAKNYIKNAVIGMAIALGAFVITQFVVQTLTGALRTNGGSAEEQNKNSDNNTSDPDITVG